MKYFFYALLLGVLLNACQKSVGDDAAAGTSTMLNVAYGTDPAQKMDVYLPAGRTADTTKVVIMIHGGAWSSGDKADFNAYKDTLRRREPSYAIVNINYRLSTGTANVFPTQENDVKTAVEYIYAHRAEYSISDKFILLGASAGGHLALLQGYKYTSPVQVKAIVDFFGPTDMTEIYNHPASPLIPQSTVAGIVGATPTSNPTLYQESSPINYVTAQSAPTIIFQGGLDPLVSVSQSTTLRDKLALNGVTQRYVYYPNEGHGWEGAPLINSFDEVQAFLRANVH